MDIIKMNSPFNKKELAKLSTGDSVLLSGVIYTARDAAHKLICESIEKGEQPPFLLEGSCIYYVGPAPARPGTVIGSAGPTTSGRMDKYTPLLLDKGLCAMIGKGARSREVIDSIVKNGAVYFGFPGGAGALAASYIKSSGVVAYEELGSEAVRRLEVENFPLTVIIDSKGKNLYEFGPEAYLKTLE